MRHWGAELDGLELGNAWALRSPGELHTNWVVGDHGGIPEWSLRFLRHGGNPHGPQLVEDMALKWFLHSPSDPPEWGEGKPISTGRSLSLLAGAGGFELRFQRGALERIVLLENPGDFALWGPGLAHQWRVLTPSTVISLRWNVPAEDGCEGISCPQVG
ncbi:MAG: hypothetical protein ACKOOH_07320 [Cyanobium sp.]